MKVEELNKKLLEKARSKGLGAEIDLAYDIAEMVIDARLKKGITQNKLARLVGTAQPGIARLESGNSLPSLPSLLKIAKALNTKLIAPKFEMLLDQNDIVYAYGETTINELNAFNLGLSLSNFSFDSIKSDTKKVTDSYLITRKEV